MYTFYFPSSIDQKLQNTLTRAEFHDDDFAAALLLLLDGEQLDDVLVLDLLQHLELAHLHLLRPHVRQLVERLHRHRLAVVLVHTLNDKMNLQTDPSGGGRAIIAHLEILSRAKRLISCDIM